MNDLDDLLQSIADLEREHRALERGDGNEDRTGEKERAVIDSAERLAYDCDGDPNEDLIEMAKDIPSLEVRELGGVVSMLIPDGCDCDGRILRRRVTLSPWTDAQDQ